MEPTESPIAWYYKLAHYRREDGSYDGWVEYLSFTKPNVSPESIQDLKPLYTKEQLDALPR